jgi:hypothetical protein
VPRCRGGGGGGGGDGRRRRRRLGHYCLRRWSEKAVAMDLYESNG